jgi:hypothetical protein
MVTQKQFVAIDIETVEGPRRFFSIDTRADAVQYVDAFRQRTLPKPKPIDSDTALTVFDAVWQAFDREYAMFVIKPNVDWGKLGQQFRPRAEKAKTAHELAETLSEMLSALEDLHVYVQVDGEHVPGYNRDRPLNANLGAVTKLVGEFSQTNDDILWAKTDDGIGYINIHKLASPRLPEVFDEVLAHIIDTKGMIVDLRFNGGGSETLARQVAGRFCDQEYVYSLSQYRSGPRHSDLSPKYERKCGPSGPWYYTGPVVVLQGQKTMSSAESFVFMLAQCPQVTTLGDRTAGSSGNPRRVDAGAGIVANLPRWLDMGPDGRPIEKVGIDPEIRVDAKPEEFTKENDPVLAAALEHLRGLRETGTAKSTPVLQKR